MSTRDVKIPGGKHTVSGDISDSGISAGCIKKLCCLALSVFLLIFSVSCNTRLTPAGSTQDTTYPSGQAPSGGPPRAVELSMAVAINDSLNPYTAKSSQNRLLSLAIYEPLCTLSNELSAINVLAGDVQSNQKYNVWQINLRPGAKFSDGSAVTSYDLVYSYQTAVKMSEYKALGDIVSLFNGTSQNGVDGIAFTLNKPDKFFSGLLTFPIIPSGSSDTKASNGRILSPCGTGPYVYQFDSGGNHKLIKNTHYNGSSPISLEEIKLVDTPDTESLNHNMSSGMITLAYSNPGDDDASRHSGKTFLVNSNNLIFIGINGYDEQLKNSGLRRALSFLVNRQKICSDAYFQNAVPAEGILNPSFTGLSINDPQAFTYNREKGLKELFDVGYTDSEGNILSSSQPIELKILVNEENSFRINAAEIIANQLLAFGIELTVEACEYDEYARRIQNLEFDLYLGEMKIAGDHNLDPLLDPDYPAASGVSIYSGFVPCYNDYRDGNTDDTELKAALSEEMPVIPLAYRQGRLTVNQNLEGEFAPIPLNPIALLCG